MEPLVRRVSTLSAITTARQGFPAGNPNNNNDIVGPGFPGVIDPGLDPAGLQNNGGPTLTIALLSNSRAIDKGTSNGLTGNLTTDQRGVGFPRTVDDPSIANSAGGDGTDVGAFELEAPPAGVLYSVNTTSDTIVIGACQNGGANCSLRGAIQTANSHPGADGISIDLPAGSVINLTGVLPDLTDSVDIIGPGANLVTVRRNTGGNYRIFNVTTLARSLSRA